MDRIGDVIFFLHTVPMISALPMVPHLEQMPASHRFRSVDFFLLLLWWVYLHLLLVIPWQYVEPNPETYGVNFDALYAVENTVLNLGLGYLWLRTSRPWRSVYFHLFCAVLLYNLGALAINRAMDSGAYSSGTFYDLPLISSFVWLGTAGIVARRDLPRKETRGEEGAEHGEGMWASRLAMFAVLILPVLALWSVYGSRAPETVREFRLAVTLVAMVVLTSLVFLRTTEPGPGAAAIAARFERIAGKPTPAADPVRAVGEAGFSGPVGRRSGPRDQ